ncbi:MAG: M3 family oligoendopeptidase [Patescibacteria group bacterium]|nr:M3 family oligoendopeptidase [Patescibacteria group bacterium]MDE1943882.1 M3 family oligoendopeptidase [Patescibacteria group bacterium]MDE1944960.1 M3 family oligoendopeptidase [Patescibacteria group bacterium]MDE2057989.1 M3 family oligoendopeptidase [Patescibacteria group bacterium]
MKTAWELDKLFYKGLKDPQIERDQRDADKRVKAFAEKYRKNKKHLKDPKALAKALADYESLIGRPSVKAGYYTSFRKELDVEDKAAEALAAKLDERAVKRGNQMLYFTLELGKVPAAVQKKFLAAKELAPYRYWLKELFEHAKHDLTEPEEKILNLLGDVAFGRWLQATDNILNKKTVAWRGKTLPLPEAGALVQTLPTKERRALYGRVREVYESVGEVAEAEINAVYTTKKIEDELRHFATPYEAIIKGYQNDVQSILALVDAVSASVSISHRFYKVKAKLLKEKRLTYADRAAQVGEVKTKVPFEQATRMVREVFGELDPRYADIFDRLLANGQVDVYPKKGKTGGAFCASGVNVPTMLLLNHIDNFESLKTLAHEMGHAIHAERAKSQRPLYQGHPISTAETASTFFETAALNRIIATLPERERLVALHDKTQDNVATVFRQIACFSFERALHEAIRKEGYLPKERIADLMNAHMRHYLGPVFELERADGYFFVNWSHIRRFFYVYSYAYGQLISSALHRHLEKDPRFIEKVDGFLAAGESASPYDIFKSCGLDTNKPAIFKEGLAAIEADVKELERLTR